MGVRDKFLLMMPDDPGDAAALCAMLNSFVLDYCARQKVGGTSLKYFTMRQLTIPAPAVLDKPARWNSTMSIREWTELRLLELIYTAWEIEPFANDLNNNHPPFRWDGARRLLLRSELDAAFFHLYGICRQDVAYIMETGFEMSNPVDLFEPLFDLGIKRYPFWLGSARIVLLFSFV